MLILTKADFTAKKQSDKECVVETNGTNNIKIILALLAKVVILYIGLPIVEIGKFSL